MGKSGAIASILVYPEEELTTKDTPHTKIERTIRVSEREFGGVKGTIGSLLRFANGSNGGEALIPFANIENVTMASFACIESLMRNQWVRV
jgi:hypothetical protein